MAKRNVFADKLINLAAREALSIYKVVKNEPKLMLIRGLDPVKCLYYYMYSQLREAMRPEPQYAGTRFVHQLLIEKLK